MRFGFILRSALILGIVLAVSPTGILAQTQAPPPLPPLPGVTTGSVDSAPIAAIPPLPVPSTAKVEVPKLPKLKTIAEIPPAKQIGSADAGESNWFDKLKLFVAKFRNQEDPEPKPRTAEAVKPTLVPLKDSAPAVAANPSSVVLPPPPPMEPPVMDALNLGNETPTVDPDVFEFDTAEKKADHAKEIAAKKAAEEKMKAASASINALPLPPKAKRNSREEVNVPVLPNPVKTAQPEIPAIPVPKPVAVAKKEPAPAPVMQPEKSWLDSLTEKALNKESVPMPAPVTPEVASIPEPPTPKTVGGLPQVAQKDLSKIAPAEKSWIDTFTEKARGATDTIKAMVLNTANDKKENEKGAPSPFLKPDPAVVAKLNAPHVPEVPKAPPLPVPEIAAVKAPAMPPLPEIKMPEPEPKVVAEVKAPALPPIPEVKLPEPQPQPKIVAEVKAPALPPIPEVKLPEPQPRAMAEVKEPVLPPIPEVKLPEPQPQVVAEEKAPVIPEVPMIKPAEHVAAAKAPAIPEIKPMAKAEAPAIGTPAPKAAVPPLPALSLSDVKLPGDKAAEEAPEKAENAPAPIVPSMEEPKVAEAKPATSDEEADQEAAKDEDTFEFGELNEKGKKVMPTKPKEAAEPKEVAEDEGQSDIADIDQQDPAFKFWKGHDFRTQVLPEVINRKEYSARNEHLPKAVYHEDMERLLFVAVARGDLNAMRALLNEGVDIEAKNAIGDTPLVHAAINGQAGAVRVLLARGANPNNPNVHGMTAMQVAAERGREDIIDALFEMGAKATADYRNPLTPLQSGATRGFASVYNAMLDGESPKKKQLDERNRALQALADAGPNPRVVISQGMPGLSKQIIDDQSKKKPGEPLTFEEIERKLAYQEYVRKTGEDPAANHADTGTIPKLISPAGATARPVPIPYPTPPAAAQPKPQAEPIIGLPQGPPAPGAAPRMQ